MENYHIRDLDIWAYVSKTADTTTKKRVEHWINSNDYNENQFNKIINLYKITSENYHDNNVDLNSAKQRFFKSIEMVEKKQFKLGNILKYAAVFAIIFTSAFYMYQNLFDHQEKVIVQTDYGEQKQIILPDGSEVWLNAASKITYYNNSVRTINLEGEAFFKVTKDKKHPFTVTTQDAITIKALGTSFNVKSYEQSDFMETVLLTGKVEVISTTYLDQKTLLLPNEVATFFKNEKLLKKSRITNLENYTAWKQGKIQFRNVAFKDLAVDLKVQLNANLIFENKAISNSNFTGSFSKKSTIENILETLKLTKDFNYVKIENNTWIIK